MSTTARAADRVIWHTDQTIDKDTEINVPILVDWPITVTVAEGKTLRVKKGIDAARQTLTFKGSGTVIVQGENGEDGANGDPNGDPGGEGYVGIRGDVVVDGPTVTCVGGSGGRGGEGNTVDGIGGNGGDGVAAIDGNLTVAGGKAELIGGAGGHFGGGKYNGSYGSDSKAVDGTITAEVIEASSDGERYNPIDSPATTDARYVHANAKVEPEPEPTPTPAGTQEMYRLYNPNSGEHFYTANKAERDNVIAAGWNDEGVGWIAPTEGEPVYRLYNENAGEHLFTMSKNERDTLVGLGWSDEGTGWMSAGNDAVPVYRQYNPNQLANNHNYTASTNERDTLLGLGWKDENVAWYGARVLK